MLNREVAISPADVSFLRRNVSRLGGYALGLVDNLDLGIERETFKEHLESTRRHLEMIVGGDNVLSIKLRPRDYTDRGLVEETGLPWNYPQTFRFASGACMISQKYHHWMSKENLRRSMAAKVLYKCQTGILDDIIDKADYSYLEAKDLYHLVLSSMTDPALDPNSFMKRLITTLRQDQLPLFDLVVSVTSNFNLLFNVSPRGRDFFYQMEALDERVALGQALSMFQKEPHLDLGQVMSISKSFESLDPEMPWFERLANYVSGGTRYNLIDISFLDRKIKGAKLKALMRGWFFLDVVIVFLNNVVSIHEDLRSGIANLSLVAMREKEALSLRSVRNYDPSLTLDDYEHHLHRLAAIASKGLDELAKHFPDSQKYYPFIAVMMPVVMLAEWIGRSDDMITLYLEALAPAIRRASEKAELRERARTPVRTRRAPIPVSK